MATPDQWRVHCACAAGDDFDRHLQAHIGHLSTWAGGMYLSNRERRPFLDGTRQEKAAVS
jgi:hypothetical protein